MTVAALFVDPAELRERFFAKTVRDEETGCLLWMASRNKKGYGQIALTRSRPALTHRVAWYLAYDRWPEPCALHHCDNPSCVEVTHLFEGTRRDNNRDMRLKGRARNFQAGQTECVHGHSLSGKNLRIRPDGKRRCRACVRDWMRRKRASK